MLSPSNPLILPFICVALPQLILTGICVALPPLILICICICVELPPLILTCISVALPPLISTVFNHRMSKSENENFEIDTFNFLNDDSVCFIESFNILGVIYVLKKALDFHGLELLLGECPLKNGSFDFSDLPLLITNLNDMVVSITLSQKSFHSFADLSENEELKEMVIKDLKIMLQKLLTDMDPFFFSSSPKSVLFLQILAIEDALSFNFLFPYVKKNKLRNLLPHIQIACQRQFNLSFLKLNTTKILPQCYLNLNNLHLWNYKVFKKSGRIREKGGIGYMQPGEGWVRFGIKREEDEERRDWAG